MCCLYRVLASRVTLQDGREKGGREGQRKERPKAGTKKRRRRWVKWIKLPTAYRYLTSSITSLYATLMLERSRNFNGFKSPNDSDAEGEVDA